MSRQEYIDKYLSKFVSRKLLVFCVASVGLFTGKLNGDNWVVVSSAYLSIEGFTKVILAIYNGKING
jgi:hypothetical protein